MAGFMTKIKVEIIAADELVGRVIVTIRRDCKHRKDKIMPDINPPFR